MPLKLYAWVLVAIACYTTSKVVEFENSIFGGRITSYKMAFSASGGLTQAGALTLNPWDGRESALGIKLGDPARVLTIARRHGILSTKSNQVCPSNTPY